VTLKITSRRANGTLYSYAGLTTELHVGDTVPATANAATVYFAPTANWNGSTTFQYAAVDNDAAQDATPATATITVASVNDAPETAPGTGSRNAGTTPTASPAGSV